jgi:hypothetical protein
MERSMSNSASMRFTASSAIGEMAGACLPRRALAAMSDSSKNWRLVRPAQRRDDGAFFALRIVRSVVDKASEEWPFLFMLLGLLL